MPDSHSSELEESCQIKFSENLCFSNIDTPPVLLLDMPFQSGDCLKEIEHIEDRSARDIAMMQYYYFTCQHELAAKKSAKYLNSEDLKIRIGALLIFTFSNMAVGHKKEAHKGKVQLEKFAYNHTAFSRKSEYSTHAFCSKNTALYSVSEEERKGIDDEIPECNEGTRLLCCYLLEQNTWNNKEWERIIGSIETALHMTKDSYPLITLYFYLSASEAALHLKDISRAETYFQKAWTLAEADGFWSPLGEMQGHLQLFLEKKIKKEHPVPYQKIIQATHQYRSGWSDLVFEDIQPKETLKKKHMQETLTGMQYSVAFLAGLGWSNQEISDYFDISLRTVKYHMTEIFYKLNINSRQQISDFLD